jgi:hypothetical protein
MNQAKEIRIIVAGSRDFSDYALLERELKAYLESVTDSTENITIISGTARGADRLGERFAQEYGLKLERYPADWDRFGKSAGYKRNELMASKATHAMVFWDGISKGTKHMIDLADAKGLEGVVINYGNTF